MSTPNPGIRIGHVERTAAQQALDEHLEAGRLDAEEYGDRYAKSAAARTQDELDALFVDLPQPHPRPAASPAPSWAPPSPTSYRAPDSPASPAEPLFGRLGIALVALIPLIAVALFIVFHHWLVFLLIPLFTTAVYGPRSGRRGMCGPRWGRW